MIYYVFKGGLGCNCPISLVYTCDQINYSGINLRHPANKPLVMYVLICLFPRFQTKRV